MERSLQSLYGKIWTAFCSLASNWRGYDALRQSELVSVFHSRVSNLQGYIVRRSNQLIISFSGTSNFLQTKGNIDARLLSPKVAVRYMPDSEWRAS